MEVIAARKGSKSVFVHHTMMLVAPSLRGPHFLHSATCILLQSPSSVVCLFKIGYPLPLFCAGFVGNERLGGIHNDSMHLEKEPPFKMRMVRSTRFTDFAQGIIDILCL
jgi:hypothetical protein